MRRLAACLCLLVALAQPAAATQDAWPALYDVQGVTAGDVLNIREGATVNSPIIGGLPPDAENVEILRLNEAETWGRVRAGGQTGWVSMRYLERQPGQVFGFFPQISRCSGTEPFWALDVAGDVASFRTPDSADTALDITTRVTARNRRDRHGLVLSAGWRGVIAYQSCSDGMSDREYGLTLDLFRPGPDGEELLSGCCTLSPDGR